MSKDMPEVKPGEIWEDNDKRASGRRLKVLEVINPQGATPPYVVCEVVANPRSGAQVGKKTTIMQRRFKANSTGYRKVQDA